MNCLLKAFSFVSKVSESKFVELLEHDGTQILWPQLDPPYCYRSFQIEEFIYCLDALDITTSLFNKKLIYAPQDVESYLHVDFTDLFNLQVKNSSGVLLGHWAHSRVPHGIANVKGKIYESGQVADYDSGIFVAHYYVRVRV
jgi:hypothetical protein